LLLKTINEYENLPELTSYKELAKMYLDKVTNLYGLDILEYMFLKRVGGAFGQTDK
jgi:hypothetical protein